MTTSFHTTLFVLALSAASCEISGSSPRTSAADHESGLDAQVAQTPQERGLDAQVAQTPQERGRDAQGVSTPRPDGSGPQRPDGAVEVTAEVSNRTIEYIELTFTSTNPIYARTCPRLQVRGLAEDQADWLDRRAFAVHSGSYLDGRLQLDLGCDAPTCDEVGIERASLIQAKQVGVVSVPQDAPPPLILNADAGLDGTDAGGRIFRVYESVQLSGEVRLFLNYYEDVWCRDQPRLFETIVDLGSP